MNRHFLWIGLLSGALSTLTAQSDSISTARPVPDRIILNFTEDVYNSFAVNWRTDESVPEGFGQIALASDSSTNRPDYQMPDILQTVKASSETLRMRNMSSSTIHHSLIFKGLRPGTLYAYRVGREGNWSEWLQYRMPVPESDRFSFIYFGDAQNNVKSMWSRVVRESFRSNPQAEFTLHAGDLINQRNEWEWDEWFYAAGFIHGMVPVIPVTGNHEHEKTESGQRELMPNWRQHFTLPENGPEGSEEVDYYVDYKHARIIVLNSTKLISNPEYRARQLKWVQRVLEDNPLTWTFVSYHHPMGDRESDKVLLEELKPLFDRYEVDLVMQGHVHSYSRNQHFGEVPRSKGGTMYTVSVSGPKFYPVNLESGRELLSYGQNKQLFQVVTVKGNHLDYKAYTVTGKLFDHFEMVKEPGGSNRIINHDTAED